MALHGDGMWETLMRLAGPYIAVDRLARSRMGAGPRSARRRRTVHGTVSARRAAGHATGRQRDSWHTRCRGAGAAVPAPGGRAGGGAGGRGGRWCGGRPRRRRPAAAEVAPDGGRRRTRRRTRPGGGPANSAGAGSIDANNPLYRSLDGEMPKRPIGGKNAKGGGWSAPSVAMGTGVVHIPHVVTVLAEIGFNGPSELQSEYAGHRRRGNRRRQDHHAAPVRHRHAEARRHHHPQVVRDGQYRAVNLNEESAELRD